MIFRGAIYLVNRGANSLSFSIQSRNYLCAQNGNDCLMRLTERRENGGKRKWRQIGQENFKREIRKKGIMPKRKGTLPEA